MCSCILCTENGQSDTKAEEMWAEEVTGFLIRSQHLESQNSPEPSPGLGLLSQILPGHLNAARGITISSVYVCERERKRERVSDP